MLTSTRARAEDVRALAGAIALGSGAGLLIGAAYLAGGHARSSFQPLPATVVPAPSTGRTIAQNKSSQNLSLAASPNAEGAPSADLRDRFRVAGAFARVVARPFDFHRVANAPSDLNCLAEAVYFEARGEATDGQRAVAQVVLNRVRHPAFPKTICAVVHQRNQAGCQFTFACSSRQAALEGSAWRRAKAVASAALNGAVMGTVGDATHFQTARSSPFAGLLKVAQIGAHVFYRFEGHAGSAAMFRQTPAPSQPVRLEMARLDVASEIEATGAHSTGEATKVAAAKVSATTTAPVKAALVTKPADAKAAGLTEATVAIKTPTLVPAPPKGADPASKPMVGMALAQS